MGGSALVLYTNAEIELLKLCAWCRDLPAGSTFLNKDNLRALTAAGQLRISRNGQSVRITESGKHTLDTLGLHFDYDSKSRGMGNYLIRRLNTANLMLFFFGGKTDVFCSSVPDRNSPLSFLPSFALRREKNKNPLGTARFNGMLYTKNTARAVYYITEENDGLYPEAERNTFTMNILTGGRKSAAAFTGDKSLERIFRAQDHQFESAAGIKRRPSARLPGYILSFVTGGCQTNAYNIRPRPPKNHSRKHFKGEIQTARKELLRRGGKNLNRYRYGYTANGNGGGVRGAYISA